MCVCPVAELYLTLCNPMDYSLPGHSFHGNFQERLWNGLPFPPSGDLPDPGIKPTPLACPTLAGRFFTAVPPGKSHIYAIYIGSSPHTHTIYFY